MIPFCAAVSVPSGDLISLGNKPKRTTAPIINPVKKPRLQCSEVEACEVVSRVEAAVNSNDNTLAESLILSALNQLRNNSGFSTGSLISTSEHRSAISGSRLSVGTSLGLLVLVKNYPFLFSRPAIIDQLITILSLTPRELGVSLPVGAVNTINSRVRGLHVLIANIICVALADQMKWPSKLIKVYLEDSLSNRVWVDQDECRLFVLNIETAFPKAYGNPKGLYTFISGMGQTGVGSSAQQNSMAESILNVLGLNCNTSNSSAEDTSSNPAVSNKHDIAEAVGLALKNQNNSLAKVIFGNELSVQVSNRFESCRQAVEVIIINILRDALGRRSGTTVIGTQSSTASNNSVISSSSISSGDATQVRNLIRTLALAVGIPEIRSLISSRLEPWLTNPKLQYHSIALLTLLATNCRLGGLSHHDLEVMISCIYRIRVKLLKPNIQSAFLECIVHLINASSMNLYCIIHLCAASEFRLSKGSSGDSNQNSITSSIIKMADTVRSLWKEEGPNGSQMQNVSNAAAIAALASTVSSISNRSTSSVGILLPFLYQRFNVQWIRIIGDLIHERLVQIAISSKSIATSTTFESQLLDEFNSRLSPLYHFLRELARFMRADNERSQIPNTNSSNAFQSNGQAYYLPCAELAAALLKDRSFRGSTTVSVAVNSIILSLTQKNEEVRDQESEIVVFQCYFHGLVGLICSLQMLSANRLFLSGTQPTRRTASYLDSFKTHHSTMRHIRLTIIRWIKNFLPPLLNAISQSCSVTLIRLRELFKPVLWIRRLFMLESVTPLNESISCYQLTSPHYSVKEIWLEQDHSLLTQLMTDTGVPEKLLNQLLLLGMEPNWEYLNPIEAGTIVCELIWRAAAMTSDTGSDSALNINKPEQLIDLLYSSCSYMSDHQLPSEMAELGFASLYWKVTLTAVILAAFCPRTCGSFLWSNYPTVKRLMEIVISNNFAYNNSDQNSCVRDRNELETERLNIEMETELVLRLESLLMASALGNSQSSLSNQLIDSGSVLVNPDTSKLFGKLIRNNPRGPCRRLPVHELNLLQHLAERLSLGHRLWRSRDPDFLLNLLHNQANEFVIQPWLIRLVESSGTDLSILPVQCLCEYYLCDTIKSMQKNKFICDNSNLDKKHSNVSDQRSLTIVSKLTEVLTRSITDSSISDAFVHSFINRLSDARYLVRMAVRECLQTIIPSAFAQETTFGRWLFILKYLNESYTLNFNSTSVTCETQNAIPNEFSNILFTSILQALHVENDLDILTANILFINYLSQFPNFTIWSSLITSLAQFITRRKSVLQGLIYRNAKLGNYYLFSLLEAMCEIFSRYIDHCCTATDAIPIDEKKSVFVMWSTERQCPFDIQFIEAQFLLLIHINEEFFVPDSDRKNWCAYLRDLWFLPINNCETNSSITTTTTGTNWISDNKPSDSDLILAYKLPSLSPLDPSFEFGSNSAHGSSSYKKQIWFENNSSSGVELRFSLELRVGLIQTNQIELVNGAFLFISTSELNELIDRLSVFILNEQTTINFIRNYLIKTNHPELCVKFDKKVADYLNDEEDDDDDETNDLDYTDLKWFETEKMDVINSDDNQSQIDVERKPLQVTSKVELSMDHDDANASEKKRKMSTSKNLDTICQYGFSELINYETQKQDITDDASVEALFLEKLVHDVIFIRNKQSTFYSDYFGLSESQDLFDSSDFLLLDELLDQTSTDLLQKLLHLLLNCPNMENIIPSRVLNFVGAVLTLPRLLYPVPRAEPRERPDSNAELPRMHYLNPTEACRLLYFVLMEAYEQCDVNGSPKNHEMLNEILNQRIALLDLAIVHWPEHCVLLLELICGFLDDNSNKNQLLTLLPESVVLTFVNNQLLNATKLWSMLAHKLLVCLYFRRPGLQSLFHSKTTTISVCHPSVSNPNSHDDDGLLKQVTNFTGSDLLQSEFDRLGPLLFVSLTSSNVSVVETAQIFCKSLIVDHPRACLRLLPLIASLSEGRLGDLTWNQFASKRYHLLFSNLLHFIELLSISSLNKDELREYSVNDNYYLMAIGKSALFSFEAMNYISDVEKLLMNLILMLTRFRAYSRHLGGIPKRLGRILKLYAHFVPQKSNSGIFTRFFENNECSVYQNLKLLASQFEEFASLPPIFRRINEFKLLHASYSPIVPFNIPHVEHQFNSKQSDVALMQPFRHKFRMVNEPQVLIGLLSELDMVSKRKISILLYFRDELESLVTHSNHMVSAVSMMLIVRLLQSYPSLTEDFVLNAVLPSLSNNKLNEPGKLFVHILKYLPDIVALGPKLTPKLINLFIKHILFSTSNETTLLSISAIEETLLRLSLDGFDTACIEYASSALISR